MAVQKLSGRGKKLGTSKLKGRVQRSVGGVESVSGLNGFEQSQIREYRRTHSPMQTAELIRKMKNGLSYTAAVMQIK